MLPDWGALRSRTSSSVVVLPQPDSPTRARVSPRRTSKEMPETAWTVPTRRLKTAPFMSGNSLTRSVTRRTSSRCSRGRSSSFGVLSLGRG